MDVFTSDSNNVKDILRLSFDDIDVEDNANRCMQYEDGKKIAEFVDKWKDIETIIVEEWHGGKVH